MKDLLIIDQKTDLNDRIKIALFNLWNNEYPVNLNYPSLENFDHYLSSLEDVTHTFILDENIKIYGWYFDFIREEEKWFGLILDSAIHGKGYGAKMMERAMVKNKELNGWVIEKDDYLLKSGKKYKSPLGFYEKLGFSKIPEEKLNTPNFEAVRINWKRS
ncbi:MAG: GNAT family N-acetyltransferase [Bacteroidota bacterium]